MADGAFGATITFSSGFFAAITGVSHSGITRGVTETTHSGTTSGIRTFIPSDLTDNGEVEVTLRFDPDDEPPIRGAAETATITFPLPAGQSTAATVAGTMFMTNFQYSLAPIADDAMEASATLKVSGALTWTPSA